MKQWAKLSEAVGEGRYEDLLEVLGHHPDRSLPDGLEQNTSEEFRVVEGLLLADASGEKSSVILTSTINSTNCFARWAFKTATGGVSDFRICFDGRRLSLP